MFTLEGDDQLFSILLINATFARFGAWRGVAAEALSRSSWSQYALVLTKLRIFQLDRKGLKKIVMMDALVILPFFLCLFWGGGG